MFELQHLNDVLVVGVHGELGSRNIRQFDEVLDSIVRYQQCKVVLDFSMLSHLDYKLVPHLVDRVVELQCSGGDLKVASVNQYILNILHAMGFEEELYPSVEQAVLSFTPMPEDTWQ